MSDFTNKQVSLVSDFIQKYMREINIDLLSADECAEILAKNYILTNTVGPKPGFNFRQMLRDGRDGVIDMVEGASQLRPNTRWRISKLK